jgi:monothiol glutaredoxin
MVPIRAPPAGADAMTPPSLSAVACGHQELPMSATDRIRAVVESHPVVLFMKGTPQFPMCGFSSRAVQALKECGADFRHVNVLEDPEIRATLPRYSDWPTFPQLFINCELIGGCDITVELHQQGELARMVAEAHKAG